MPALHKPVIPGDTFQPQATKTNHKKMRTVKMIFVQKKVRNLHTINVEILKHVPGPGPFKDKYHG